MSIVLSSEPFPQTVNAANGGTVNVQGGASVLFPSNAFVIAGTTTPYTGNVSISSKLLATDDPNFSKMIPGGDLLGNDLSGNDVVLYSYGMLNVTMHGSSG